MSTEAHDREQIEEQRHEQALEQQAHSANLVEEEALNARAQLLDKLMESDLDSGTVEALDNYISPDFILSKMDSADLTQFEWQLETAMIQLFAMHPPQGGVANKARAYYYDDPKDALVPLKPQDRSKLRAFKDGIIQRVRRSHEGYQQDKIGETTSRVETVNRDEEEESSGKIGGLLGR